jgi:mannose-1-phosphate guanylyltransferase
MLARVPFIPRLDAERDAPPSHVWTIILTGDEPPVRRRAHRARGCHTSARWPVAAAAAAGAHGTLQHAARLAPAGQTVAVVTRRRAAAWEPELAAVPNIQRIVQPVDRGRAAEVLLPLLKIARLDPTATVVVLPADQSTSHDARFFRYVTRAVWAVVLRPDLPIVIGAHPDAPVVDGWIEPGPPVEGLEDLAVRSVKSFVDDASPAERRRLFDADALTTTSTFVARARTLRALAARALPEVLEALEPLEEVFGRPEEPLLCEAVYEGMPRVGLAPLQRAPGLAVLALPDVVWRTPEQETLELLAS